MNTVVLFTGGGTGGHLFPGVAVIEKLRRSDPSLDVRWLGSRSPLEAEVIGRFGVPLIRLPSGKLRRYLSLRNLFDLFKVAAGLIEALFVMRNLRPALLFSKGGYVSVPPVVAAHLLKVPIVVHDSDLDPGLATRIGARFAETVCVPYEESRAFFSERERARVIVTGNPVREEIFAGDAARGRAAMGAPAGLPLLLVLGGSQGAREINCLIEQAAGRLTQRLFIVHQTGRGDFTPSSDPRYRTVPFLSESYADVLAAADLVVARSGAGTLWELAARGRPSILIPLSTSSSRGDQVRNAELFAARGAAVVMPAPDARQLADGILGLLDEPSRLHAMGEAARSIGRGNAAQRIAALILERIGEGNAAGSP